MPRVTPSSAKAPAPKSIASKDSALQPKSHNVRKRPRNNSFEKNELQDTEEPSAVKKTKTKTKTLKNAQGWNVSVNYSLICTSRYQPVDASSYSLELHCHQNSNQLFATFEFGDLKGVMRLCPEKALSSKADSEESEDEDEEDEEPKLLLLDESRKRVSSPMATSLDLRPKNGL